MSEFKYSYFGQLANEQAHKTQLAAALSSNQQEQTQIEGELASNNASIKLEGRTIEQYKNLLDVTKAGTPLNRLYGGIKEFKIENSGMCGMGMGMGSMVESSLQLTGQELLDIDELLKSNDNGQFSFDDLAQKLQEKGYNVGSANSTANTETTSNISIEEAITSTESSSQSGIKITRSDGTQIEIKDCNGDGLLNSQDYDFSEALAKFNADMDVYEKNIAAIEAEIAAHEETKENLENENKNLNTELSIKETEETEIKSDIKETDNKISDLISTQAFEEEEEVHEEYDESYWRPFLEDLRLANSPNELNKAWDRIDSELKAKPTLSDNAKQKILSERQRRTEQALHNDNIAHYDDLNNTGIRSESRIEAERALRTSDWDAHELASQSYAQDNNLKYTIKDFPERYV